MKEIKFDHTEPSMAGALGISEDRTFELDACVMYNILVTEIIARKLYGENREDAPVNVRKRSGILEKILDYAIDEVELVYLAYEFVEQDKFTDTEKGRIFATALAMKLQDDDIEMDEEKFTDFWKDMGNNAKRKNKNS